MRRIRDPLGYPILREGQILHVKLNVRSNVRGLSRPAGPAVIRWEGAAHGALPAVLIPLM